MEVKNACLKQLVADQALDNKILNKAQALTEDWRNTEVLASL